MNKSKIFLVVGFLMGAAIHMLLNWQIRILLEHYRGLHPKIGLDTFLLLSAGLGGLLGIASASLWQIVRSNRLYALKEEWCSKWFNLLMFVFIMMPLMRLFLFTDVEISQRLNNFALGLVSFVWALALLVSVKILVAKQSRNSNEVKSKL